MSSHGGSVERLKARGSELAPSEVALFLDVDGTLIEIAPTPEAVTVEPVVIDLLRGLALLGGGAIALVSGRGISTLDELFAPLLLPVAGLHGFETRNALGVYCRRPPPPGQLLERARRLMRQIAARNPKLLLEDKRFAMALHYRQAPELENEVVSDVMAVSRISSLQLEAQRGRKVIELLPRCATKGQAVAEFMEESPFEGRCPIYIGDDLTDESAFHWVNTHGGVSIAVNVNRPTAAQERLANVSEVHGWLRALVGRGT